MLCYICLLEPKRYELTEDRHINWLANDAVTTVAGTSVCRDHIKRIANAGVLAVQEEQQ